MQANSVLFHQIYVEAKFWLSVGGAFWILFKCVNWVKAIRENDLTHLQTGVDNLHTELQNQTSAVVKELQEMRLDFRTYFAPAQVVRTKSRKRKK
jgi:hypothetical protein